MALHILLLMNFLVAISSSTASDLLQNSDFESPPTGISASNTTTPVLLMDFNNIPGWSFDGIVFYVTSGLNVSLPDNGHGILLGRGGKINQTFRGDGHTMDYVLTFTLAPWNKACSNNFTAVIVSASVSNRSKEFKFEGRYGMQRWESHAFYLGMWFGAGEAVNLEIKSVLVESTNLSMVCGAVVDNFFIKKIGVPISYGENMLWNNGFEVGPAFLRNSTMGILLQEEPDQEQPASLLQQWLVIGTVKYVDSRHYAVPEGKAAIEIVSAAPSGITATLALTKGLSYNLEFVMGDAKDSCLGDLVLYVQAGASIRNFTLRSNGTGSSMNCSMSFRAESSLTPISFMSFNETRTHDNVSCGPMIDNVELHSVKLHSVGLGQKLQDGIVSSCLAVFVVLINIPW